METQVSIQKKYRLTGWLSGLLFLFLFSGCQYGSDMGSDFSSGEGTGGSMARFTITANHLYVVDQTSLKVFSLNNAQKPEFLVTRNIGFGIETIFPINQNLFLGTSTGMYIYDIKTPENPQKVSFYQHVYSCDPVVSDGKYAYVTLSSANQRCWRATNELQIIDLQNLQSPTLVSQYTMTQPRGLAIRNDTLWVCDQGLKIYDTRNKQQIKLLYHFKNIQAYDIILKNKLALVSGETGFVQYTLSNDSIKKLSEIKVFN
jgi:hypothetical protein